MSTDPVDANVLSGVRPLENTELGRGAYGRVYTVKHNGSVYAAKEIHELLLQCDPGKVREDFIRECSHCSKLSHPNIVSFKGVYYRTKNQLPAMIMELMDESLTKYVETKPGSSFERKASILHDVARGLEYLHSYTPTIIHRDLSPNNVLLKHAGKDHVPPVAKIADLGVAKVIKADCKSTQSRLTKAPGTQDFMPPEALVDDPQYDASLDVFSYGGIMLHTINDEWPTPTQLLDKYDQVTKSQKAFTEIQRRKKYLDKMTGEAEVLRPLVEACLDNDPTQRPSIKVLACEIEKYKERVGGHLKQGVINLLSVAYPATRKLPREMESPCLSQALQSGYYNIDWTKCAKLPFHVYGASVATDGEKVFVMAGSSLESEALYRVLCYDSKDDRWDELPQPGHYWGILYVIDGKLTVIGGSKSVDDQPVPTNKVLTYNKQSNSWTKTYPNMLHSRCKPGVIMHSDYVLAVGGESSNGQIRDDIEVLNWREPTQWMMANVHLPMQMWAISMTILDSDLYILGYSGVDWRYTTAYQIPADPIITSVSQPGTSNDVTFTEIPPVPYWHATVVPNLCPPTIVGGCSSSGNNCTAEINTFDGKAWQVIGSLSTARCGVGIALINTDTIIVIGGSTDPSCIDLALAHSCDYVERGQVKPQHYNV